MNFRYVGLSIAAAISMISSPTYSDVQEIPVDQYGMPCLSMAPTGTDVLSNGASKYNYEIKNSCDRGFSLGIITNAGWTGLVDVGPGGRSTWFCTDGVASNKDCNGGAGAFEVR